MNRTERNGLLDKTMQIDGCDMEKFGTLVSSEKTIDILGDR